MGPEGVRVWDTGFGEEELIVGKGTWQWAQVGRMRKQPSRLGVQAEQGDTAREDERAVTLQHLGRPLKRCEVSRWTRGKAEFSEDGAAEHRKEKQSPKPETPGSFPEDA